MHNPIYDKLRFIPNGRRGEGVLFTRIERVVSANYACGVISPLTRQDYLFLPFSCDHVYVYVYIYFPAEECGSNLYRNNALLYARPEAENAMSFDILKENRYIFVFFFFFSDCLPFVLSFSEILLKIAVFNPKLYDTVLCSYG